MTKELSTIGKGTGELLAQGHAMQQIQTAYHTAVSVQRPRNILDIKKMVLMEMELGGASHYYSWMVTDKNGNKKPVEGLSIGGEVTIARLYGNCAIETTHVEEKDAYIFTSYFIDLQNGFTISRIYKKTKTTAPGKYSKDQWADMEFGIGQSKAQRNAAKAGLPGWLQDEALRTAKQAALKAIDDEGGIVKATEKALAFLLGKGIEQDLVELTIGKPAKKWTNQDIVMLRGMCQQIHDGVERAEDLFQPTPAEKHKRDVQKTQEERKQDVGKNVSAAMGKKEPEKFHCARCGAEVGENDESCLSCKNNLDNENIPSSGAVKEVAEAGLDKATTFSQDDESQDRSYGDFKTILDNAKGDTEKIKSEWFAMKDEAQDSLAPRSFTRLHNYARQICIGLDSHVEPENEITTKEPVNKQESMLKEYKKTFEMFDSILACNKFLVNKDEELRENLTAEEYNDFQEFALEHKAFVKSVQENEANQD